MIDAVGNPQSLLLLGGTSDIALAIAEKYLAERPLRVVLAARPSPRLDAAAQHLKYRGAEVSTVDFDATDTASHPAVLAKAFEGGDIDVTVPESTPFNLNARALSGSINLGSFLSNLFGATRGPKGISGAYLRGGPRLSLTAYTGRILLHKK